MQTGTELMMRCAPTIGEVSKAEKERVMASKEQYLTSFVTPDGRTHRVYVLLGQIQGTWDACKEWAQVMGGTLPDSVISAFIAKYRPDLMTQGRYWLDEPYRGLTNFAWCIWKDGTRIADAKCAIHSAIAVRIEST